jgi:hypothetical protein
MSESATGIGHTNASSPDGFGAAAGACRSRERIIQPEIVTGAGRIVACEDRTVKLGWMIP